MSATATTTDRVARRRAETRERILEAAWRLARRDGIAGLSLRDLAGELGMRAPSLYGYFDSKDAIYDAMFRQGYEQLLAATRGIEVDPSDPGAALREGGRRFLRFCTDDPARFQLLFQRSVPGFAPSDEAYEPSIAAWDEMVTLFAAIGIDELGLVDLWTAIVSGLASQQLANEPGGHRWAALLDDAVDMFLAHAGVPS
jgi:AcrR family transcriptional regulator